MTTEVFDNWSVGMHRLKQIQMIQNKTWTTKDGEEIPVNLLETSHIRNIISLLKRRKLAGLLTQATDQETRNNFVKIWLPILQKELDKRDAEYFIEISAKSIDDIFPLGRSK